MVLKLFKGETEIKPGSVINNGSSPRLFNSVIDENVILVQDTNAVEIRTDVRFYTGYEIRDVPVPQTAYPSIDEVIDVLRKAFPARAFGDVKTEPAPMPKMHTIADAAHDRFPNSDKHRAGFIAGAQWAFRQGK